MSRRWRRVSDMELEYLIEDLRRQDHWYAGCVHAELGHRYGSDNIRHRAGYGWYKLTAPGERCKSNALPITP